MTSILYVGEIGIIGMVCFMYKSQIASNPNEDKQTYPRTITNIKSAAYMQACATLSIFVIDYAT